MRKGTRFPTRWGARKRCSETRRFRLGFLLRGHLPTSWNTPVMPQKTHVSLQLQPRRPTGASLRFPEAIFRLTATMPNGSRLPGIGVPFFAVRRNQSVWLRPSEARPRWIDDTERFGWQARPLGRSRCSRRVSTASRRLGRRFRFCVSFGLSNAGGCRTEAASSHRTPKMAYRPKGKMWVKMLASGRTCCIQ